MFSVCYKCVAMNRLNILVIGVGPHAKRIYIPTLMKLSDTMPVQLVAIVDLKKQKQSIDSYFTGQGYNIETLYLDSFDVVAGMPNDCKRALDSLVEKLGIQGVVISTEPTVHKMYAEWALERGLHILMDKPISVRKSISTNLSQAIALMEDYDDLLSLYKQKQNIKSTVFSINVQRRYEYGFDVVKELIAEASNKFNIPVTSIQAMHADGTWMFPNEVLTQESHGHSDGFGKIAHSGYHIFDMVWQLYKSGIVHEKLPDRLEFFSSPLTPSGLNTCLSEIDYRKYFGSEYEETGLSEKEYLEKIKTYGEIDSFNVVRLLRDKENICNISINLLHSSFSRRSWVIPNTDRYKSNGRVKHQQFIIQQGPFQCIQIHNYQSKDLHDVDNSNEFEVGGNNHFDIYVFRNVGMFGFGEAFYKISAKDLEEEERTTKLVIEKAKERVVLEFVSFMMGKIDKDKLKSNIDTHEVSVKIMSGIYQSGARLINNQNPIVNIPL